MTRFLWLTVALVSLTVATSSTLFEENISSPPAVADSATVSKTNSSSLVTVGDTGTVLQKNSSPLQAVTKTSKVPRAVADISSVSEDENNSSVQAVIEISTGQQQNSFHTTQDSLPSDDTSRICSGCNLDRGDGFDQLLEKNGSEVEISTQTLSRCMGMHDFLTIPLSRAVDHHTKEWEIMSVSYLQNGSNESGTTTGTCWLKVLVSEERRIKIDFWNQTCTPGNSIFITENDPRGNICMAASDNTRGKRLTYSGKTRRKIKLHNEAIRKTSP